MDTIDQDDTLFDDCLESERDMIRRSLNQIASDVSMMLRDVGLTFPVFLTVPSSGNSLATIATPIDPSDEDWTRASAIVCQIIEDRCGTGEAAQSRTAMRNDECNNERRRRDRRVSPRTPLSGQ